MVQGDVRDYLESQAEGSEFTLLAQYSGMGRVLIEKMLISYFPYTRNEYKRNKLGKQLHNF